MGAVAFADNAGKNEAVHKLAYNWPAPASAISAPVKCHTDELVNLIAEQKTEWAEAVAELGVQTCVACTNRSFEKDDGSGR